MALVKDSGSDKINFSVGDRRLERLASVGQRRLMDGIIRWIMDAHGTSVSCLLTVERPRHLGPLLRIGEGDQPSGRFILFQNICIYYVLEGDGTSIMHPDVQNNSLDPE